jgi:endonuclease/exonuclease/phosphatase family metal-dependent hydrolase
LTTAEPDIILAIVMGLGVEVPNFHVKEATGQINKNEKYSWWKEKGKQKLAAGVALVALFGVGAKASDINNDFSTQTVKGDSISVFEANAMKRDLITQLEKEGIVGEKGKPIPFEVITYNTAAGNSKIKAPQAKFINLPFYQKVIRGESDAPIVALQEAGIDQIKMLARQAGEDGNFSIVSIKSHYSNGGNLLLIPKRFEVVEAENSPFTIETQVKGAFDSLKDEKKTNMSQLFPRAWSKVKLKDRLANDKILTVINTHLSYDQSMQQHQADELFAGVKEAEKDGPVIVMGDLNANANLSNSKGKNLMQNIKESGYVDMGPRKGPKGKANIDSVLTKGFRPVKENYLLDISLPGYPIPENISDHYAEADWVQMNK